MLTFNANLQAVTSIKMDITLKAKFYNFIGGGGFIRRLGLGYSG